MPSSSVVLARRRSLPPPTCDWIVLCTDSGASARLTSSSWRSTFPSGDTVMVCCLLPLVISASYTTSSSSTLLVISPSLPPPNCCRMVLRTAGGVSNNPTSSVCHCPLAATLSRRDRKSTRLYSSH